MARKEDKFARYKLYQAFQTLNSNTIYYGDQQPVSRKDLEGILGWSEDRVRSSLYYHLSRGHVERCGKIDNNGKKKLVGFKLSREMIDFSVKRGFKFRPEPVFTFKEVQKIVKRALSGDKKILDMVFS